MTIEKPRILPVLVIENDPSLLDRIRVILENLGYPVVGQNWAEDVPKRLSACKVTGIVVGNSVVKDFRHWLSDDHTDIEKRTFFLTERFSPTRLVSAAGKLFGKPPKTERILVVDNEEAIREIVGSMLSWSGYRCRTVPGGPQALELLGSGESFDLVTSDLMNLPMDGISLLEELKRRYPDIPVVMVTAIHDISVALAAIRTGAFDYLLKPFEREQLINTVHRALEHRCLKTENRELRAKLARFGRKRARDTKKADAD